MAKLSRTPRPLKVAALVSGIQGLAMVGLAVLQVVAVAPGRLAIALGVGALFLAYGVLLILATRSLLRGESWGRGPVLLTQLIQLGVAWGIRADAPLVLTGVLVVTAATAIVGIVHPSSVAYLNGVRADEQADEQPGDPADGPSDGRTGGPAAG